MSMAIHKYYIPIQDVADIYMPVGAKVLSAQRGFQRGEDGFFVWAWVNPLTTETVLRRFYVVGTGNPLPHYVTPDKHVATAPMGPFVWHLFQEAV